MSHGLLVSGTTKRYRFETRDDKSDTAGGSKAEACQQCALTEGFLMETAKEVAGKKGVPQNAGRCGAGDQQRLLQGNHVLNQSSDLSVPEKIIDILQRQKCRQMLDILAGIPCAIKRLNQSCTELL